MRLQKVNAVITGASSGIGQAVASHFRREGANLLLTGRRPELPESHPDDLYLAGDLNDETFVSGLATRAADHLGEVGVVVLCHGLQQSSPLAETTADDARDLLHSNLLSAFLVMKHLMPLAPESGASMVCVSSRLGMVGMPNQTLYSAAKGGLIALARGAAIEWASRNIRVNVVAPGLTVTPLIEASFQRRPDPAAYRRAREDSIPLRRLATPEEVADAVLFLACPESSYITGAVLPVDGGYTAF
ncbi:SDR family oxidoreductase [Streptomyces ferrugineus]|uniref:SDR family oxidoreductase n=1 Tax=Streptomyces ferrugineus TaxID=1413221 RepID=A0A7M2SDM7_9ACTN|nr:SDR family NAD(P)-dependent oxidoreductase [Streptomyces ferrugineus]QOV34447.1 SDR family oxidoreductase [Streptomyces ferrugineus]